ncbi:hypothetical protein ACFQI7_15775 [Paenibacillus allorhizosphaerae]|uniref:hypothetical protein n=1 Tax=Paenibacillus allorhizosphaerae TaxID=2849866 RepID=UPI001C404966|nr:hypothetical protein [Paenibacillus allorhizosphaerae]
MVYMAAISDRYTCATFQALVDAVIPPTLGLCQAEYVPGAMNWCIHEFVIMEVDLSQDPHVATQANVPFSRTTAVLLDIGAARLLRIRQSIHPALYQPSTGGGLFSSLSRNDRLRAVELLNRLDVCLRCLPLPYRNNPALIQTMMNSLQQLTLFGFYSE